MKKGLLIVYTGNGKGKTTAALGAALRAVGHDMRVCMIQFIKGGWKSGELNAVKNCKGLFDIIVKGEGFLFNSEDIEKHRPTARDAWEHAKRVISSSEYEVVVLDEFTYLLNYGLIEEKDAVEFLRRKPEGLHIIVTGRNAPNSLIDIADLVTDMRVIKHPFQKGIKAQRGIDY